jgi:hypothetical protein
MQNRSQTSLPMKAPTADIFSPQYAPADLQPPPQIPAPLRLSAQPTTSISARSAALTRDSSAARSPSPANTSDPAAAAPPTVKAAKHIPEPAKSLSDSAPPKAAIPPISEQPATPMPSSILRKSDNPEDEEAALDRKRAAALEDSPTVGRMTNAAREALRKGFGDLNACINRISAETGLKPAQIVERWDVAKTRVVSTWNIYQTFFEERREQELARLDADARPPCK